MANNYFGFPPGGTQYSAQPAAAYAAPAAQTAYVQPAQPTYAPAPRAQTYDAYPAATHTAGQYAYATRTQVGAAAQPTATYDATKTYYAPTAAAPAATTVYTVAEPTYQAVTAKPVYSSTTYAAQVAPRVTHTAKTPAAGTANPTYTYQPATTATVSAASSTYGATNPKSTYSYSGYDAAVYSAATSYYQQQQKTGTTTGTSGTAVGSTAPTWQQKKTFQPKPKPKQPPKQPQLHYCEVCKISCAGPQTYREHLEGQKHKKKEAAAKSSSTAGTGSSSAMRIGTAQLRCELCDVSCTGADAYAAHIRGAKHQKVLKLHTKLGKPIPSTDPIVVSSNTVSNSTSVQASAKPSTVAATAPKAVVGGAKPGAVPTPAAALTNPAAAAVKKVVATPKITFVGGTQLKTTGTKTEEVKTEVKPEVAVPTIEEKLEDIIIPGEKDVVPVGQEYIEEVRNEFGNVVSFHCKLCECKFNDPNAKIMHMKGRRHRLQYKKKVDPSLLVEVKPSIRARKIQEEKLRRQAAKEEYWRRRDAEERWRMEWEQRRYEEEMLRWQGHGRGMPFGPTAGPMQMRRSDTSDDRHVMAKHASIYPNEQELQAVQKIVSSCEKALKLVSDQIAVSDAPKPMDTEVKKEVKKEAKKEKETKEEKKEEPKKKKVPTATLR